MNFHGYSQPEPKKSCETVSKLISEFRFLGPLCEEPTQVLLKAGYWVGLGPTCPWGLSGLVGEV